MKVVHAKSAIEEISDEVERSKRDTGKLPLEILLSPSETLELKRIIWYMLPKKWHTDPGLPPELKLWGVPIRVDEAVIG